MHDGDTIRDTKIRGCVLGGLNEHTFENKRAATRGNTCTTGVIRTLEENINIRSPWKPTPALWKEQVLESMGV